MTDEEKERREKMRQVRVLMNYAPNKKLRSLNWTEVGYGYKIVFAAAVTGKDLKLAEAGYVNVGQLRITMIDIAAYQSKRIISEVRAFASENPPIGAWTKGGEYPLENDAWDPYENGGHEPDEFFWLTGPFTYVVTKKNVITVV